MSLTTIRLAYKNLAWFIANPTIVLKQGQIVYVLQTGTYKIGDGVNQLSALLFLGTGSLVFNNGITKTSSNVQLGGSIIQNTNISGSGFDLNLGLSGSGNEFNNLKLVAITSIIDAVAYNNTIINNSGIIILASDNINVASFTTYTAPQFISANGTNNSLVIKDTYNSKGLVNASDYSANFTPESLVTKRFTDNIYALKLLTGYVSGAGTVAGTDTVLQAIQKLNGNIASIPTTSLTATQIAFGSSGNSISSSSNLVVNTTTGNLSAPLVINVGGIPTGGYDVFNHFQMPEQLIAFKSTTSGKSSEIQVYNNLNALQFGIEGSINGNRMGGTLAYNMYFGCYYNYGLTFHSNNLVRGYLSPTGNWFFGGNTLGTAIVHIKAGTATANTAPLKFTSGTNLTTVEDGSIEYDSTNFFASAKGTRQVMLKGLSGSFSGTGTATTAFTVTFGNTQPNNIYQVNITPTNALTAAVLYVTSKTTTTFTVTFLTGLTGAVSFDWILIQ